MTNEFEALETNRTWVVVDLPLGKKHIGCKWVYKVKYKADGAIEKYKTRLVVRGDTQVEGVGFHKTFSQVVKCPLSRLWVLLPSRNIGPCFSLMSIILSAWGP